MNYPELKTASVVFMFVLLLWSLSWIVYAVFRLRKSTDKKLYWQTHFVWSLINILISGNSLISTVQTDMFTSDRAISLRNIVAINILLDVVYIAVAIVLKKSEDINKIDVGRAILVQGSFLLLLDTTIVMTFLAVMAK